MSRSDDLMEWGFFVVMGGLIAGLIVVWVYGVFFQSAWILLDFPVPLGLGLMLLGAIQDSRLIAQSPRTWLDQRMKEALAKRQDQ